jgi:hypothetical protein
MKNKNPDNVCCKKMAQVLLYKDSNFRFARNNLIVITAGYEEMACKGKLLEAMKRLKRKIGKSSPLDSKILSTPDKVVKYSMLEAINFCPFCGKQLKNIAE